MSILYLNIYSTSVQEIYYKLSANVCTGSIFSLNGWYSHVNDISTLEMHMRWLEKEFSNMRFAIGWGNAQTWDVLLLDEGILSMRCLCDALILGEGILKHKAHWYWMSELSNISYFVIGWRNSQTWFALLLFEGPHKYDMI